MAVVDELVTILGVKLAGGALGMLKSFKDGIADASRHITFLGLSVTAAATVTGLFIKGVADEAASLDKLSQKTGISTDAIQEWQYAAKKSGVDAKAVTNDLVALQKTMSSPIPGQFNTTMAMFGVSARNSNGQLKTTDKLLEDMADKFKGMSAQRAAQWASKFGISDDTLLLLRKGTVGIEELRKEAHKLGGIIPQDSVKIAANFNKKLAELQFSIRGITSQVAIATIPAISRLVDGFKELIENNREFISLGLQSLMGGIVNGFDRFLEVVGKIFDKFKPLTDAIKNFLPEMEGTELVTHLVTGALTGLLIIFSPLIAKFALIGAAVLAATVLFEDFFTFLESGGGVTGKLFDAFAERWPDLFNSLSKLWNWLKNNIEPAFDAVWSVIEYVGEAFGDIGAQILDVINSIAGPISDFFSTFEDRFPGLSRILKRLASILGSTVKAAFDMVVASIKMVISVIGELLGWIGTAIEKLMEFINWLFESDEEQKKRIRNDPNFNSEVQQSVDNMKLLEQANGDMEVYQKLLEDAKKARDAKAEQEERDRFRNDPATKALIAQGNLNLEKYQNANGISPILPSSQKVPKGGGMTQYNDNKQVQQTIVTSDPVLAGRAANDALNNSSSLNVNNPGAFAPGVM